MQIEYQNKKTKYEVYAFLWVFSVLKWALQETVKVRSANFDIHNSFFIHCINCATRFFFTGQKILKICFMT